MKFIKPALLALSLAVVSVSASASINPSSYGFDQRVQFFDYNAHDVFVIGTDIGISTLIQLEEDERIDGESTGLGMGDAQAWSLAVKGNNIFIKPTAALPDTNMVIVTNKRTYAIQLRTDNVAPSYIVRFKYPEKPKENNQTKSVVGGKFRSVGNDANGAPILVPENVNTNYYKRGAESILPSRVWDDGLFTYMKYPNNKDLPVVFSVLTDTSEAIVNSHVADDVLVIHGTNPIYRLRMGGSVGEIYNRSYNSDGYFNERGTSDQNMYREVK